MPEDTKNAPKTGAKIAAKNPTDAQIIESMDSFETKYAPLVKAKVRAGLTKEQALTVIRNQIKEDASIAEAQLQEATAKK